MNIDSVCQEMGRSRNSIWKQMCILGISKRKKVDGYKDINGTYFNSVIYSATKRKLSFSIDSKYIWQTYIQQKRKCAYSGIKVSFDKKWSCRNTKRQTASIDRIDSSKGYVEGNIQIVHKDINNMKMGLSEDRFLELCQKVVKNANSPES